jgi:beta-lactamase regulating signal transducer with metallopeptidase domain
MTLEIIFRTSALLLAAAALVALLRRAAPSTRHLVWHLAIITVILAPVLAPLAPAIAVPGVPGVPTGFVLSTVPGSIEAFAEPETQQHHTLGTFGSLGTLGRLGTLFVVSWFLLCWLMSGVSVWSGARPAPESWLNEARAIGCRMGLKGPVAIRELRRDASPHVAGFFQSVVMLPPAAASWTVEARQAALVHELTHIKRHDRRTQAIAQLACAIYWFNPLVWHAAAGLARERERACDDEVLRFGAKPSAYATLLLEIARNSQFAWMPATALSMARPSAIEGRLLSILADAARAPRRSTRWLVGLAIITITTTILGAQAANTVSSTTATQATPSPILRPPTVMSMDEAQAPMAAATRALIDALSDANRQVREHAAMRLAITPGGDVIEPLLNALKDPDAQVREKAVIGLAFRRDPKIVDPLLAALEDSDGQVREKAAIALGASGDPRALTALTKATKDPDPQVREKAVGGLVLLGLRK